MSMSVEAGPQSPETGTWARADNMSAHENKIDQDTAPDASNLRARYGISNPGGHLTVEEARQLPSPSPSPSPRSTSPLLLATDFLSAESTKTPSSAPNGHGNPGSFEKATRSASNCRDHGETFLASPFPILKTLPPRELHDIPEEKIRKSRKLSSPKPGGSGEDRISETDCCRD